MTKRKRPEDLQDVGRTTIYTQELADLICDRVATTTFGLARLCAMYDDMPAKITINVWRYKYPSFAAQYHQAKMIQAELLAEEMLDIADDASNDWMASLGEDGEAKYRINGEHVQRSRLRIDTRKFLVVKLLPKKYGEKVDDQNVDKTVVEMLINKLAE